VRSLTARNTKNNKGYGISEIKNRDIHIENKTLILFLENLKKSYMPFSEF